MITLATDGHIIAATSLCLHDGNAWCACGLTARQRDGLRECSCSFLRLLLPEKPYVQYQDKAGGITRRAGPSSGPCCTSSRSVGCETHPCASVRRIEGTHGPLPVDVPSLQHHHQASAVCLNLLTIVVAILSTSGRGHNYRGASRPTIIVAESDVHMTLYRSLSLLLTERPHSAGK